MPQRNMPWVRPGVVVHDVGAHIDDLLGDFASAVRARGFTVAGYVQRNNTGEPDLGHGCAAMIELENLANGQVLTVDGHAHDGGGSVAMAVASLNAGINDGADLVVVSRFSAFEKAAGGMSLVLDQTTGQGTPLLTSIAGRCLHKWNRLVQRGGAMVGPDMESLWSWWGPDRLYEDLLLGVGNDEIRRIVCGPRWAMVESASRGVGLAYLPCGPQAILPRLVQLEREGLRNLAEMINSWKPLEMALGIAAINAHYNDRRTVVGEAGNGAEAFREETGRVIVIGAFPRLSQKLPNATVIETAPRPGELPVIAMDTVVPGCSAMVVTSSTLINRKLPHILRLAGTARVAVVGPTTPITPRLHEYGIEVLGGLLVHDADGLSKAVRAGAPPKDFDRFGRYVHIQRARPSRPVTETSPLARRKACQAAVAHEAESLVASVAPETHLPGTGTPPARPILRARTRTSEAAYTRGNNRG